jgi:hypothetical protein
MLKQVQIILIACAIGLLSPISYAAKPTDINYCKKGRTTFGKRYSTYIVRCSDGQKREITAWDERQKWCVGQSDNCTNDQLKAAKKACNSR